MSSARFLGLTVLLLAACGGGDEKPCGPGFHLEDGVCVEGDTGSAPVDMDGDGYTSDEDCNDTVASIHPGADEYCNGVDDDCDGLLDEDDAVDAPTWYADDDGDGYGDPTTTITSCEQPQGYLERGEDCDDTDPDVHPGADEYCNGVDDDCDGQADEEPVDGITWYPDADEDGYGDPDAPLSACSQPSGYVLDASDCDDSDASVHPEAEEFCNARDDDCDGAVDEDPVDGSPWYADMDEDGYGDPDVQTLSCRQPSGYVANPRDCDDTDADVHPGADEYCNGVDDDCDGDTDEGTAVDAATWYADNDGDGFGSSLRSMRACEQPTGYVADATDCDDTDPTAYPGATEYYDGVDNDCNGLVDDDAICLYPDVDYSDTRGPTTPTFSPVYVGVSFVGTIEDGAVHDYTFDSVDASALLIFDFYSTTGTYLCSAAYDADDATAASGWSTDTGGVVYEGYTFTIADGVSDCDALAPGTWGVGSVEELVESWTWGIGVGELDGISTELRLDVEAAGYDWLADWAPYVMGGYVYSDAWGEAREYDYVFGYVADCGDVMLDLYGDPIPMRAASSAPLSGGVYEVSAYYLFYAADLIP